MDIEEGLVAYLNARAAVTALVGNRIYPMLVPQGSDNYPAVTYQIIDASSDVTFDGPSGLAMHWFQVTSWARTYLAMKAVRNALYDALSGFKGSMGTVTVQGCFKSGERDQYDPSPGLETARVYGRQMDFKIWWNEPIPSYA